MSIKSTMAERNKNPTLAPKITLLWLRYCNSNTTSNARPSLHVALRTTDQAVDFYSPFRPYFTNTPRSLSLSLSLHCNRYALKRLRHLGFGNFLTQALHTN